MIFYQFFSTVSGDRGERDAGVPAVRVPAVADPVPGMRARAVHVGRVLVVRHRAGFHQPAPPVGHVQDGTGLGPGRGGRPQVAGARRPRSQGGRHVHHSRHTGRPHQLDGVHDRREGGRHDQRGMADAVDGFRRSPLVRPSEGQTERRQNEPLAELARNWPS